MTDLVPRADGKSDLLGPVRNLMSSPVVFADSEVTLRSLAQAMSEEEVGAVILLGPEGPSMLVSERDVVEALAAGADPDMTWAWEIGTARLVAAGPDDRVLEVARAMVFHNIRHVPIRHGSEITGMVSARDVLRVMTQQG